MKEIKTINEYVNQFPEETQNILEKIGKIVKDVAPEAVEMISYKMPTFELGKNRFYFAAYKKHIGFYAIYQPTDFEEELTEYRTTKDTIQFPLDKEIPYDLIEKIIKYKLFEK